MLATVTHQCYTKAKFKGKLLCCKKKNSSYYDGGRDYVQSK